MAPEIVTSEQGRERETWSDEPDGEQSVLRGALAGAVGGLAASFGMTLLLRAMEHAGQDHPHHPQHSLKRGTSEATAETQSQSSEDDATVEAVERIAHAAGVQLSERGKRVAGPLAHYLFGAGVAALYGALAARKPAVTAGCGLAFGAAVWLLADEIGIPALGLSPPPWKSPAPVHLRGAAAHVVYGPGTELVRRLLA
jgi:putative membrane protein